MATKKPRLPMNALAATFHPNFKPGSKAHETWKHKYYIFPDEEVNESIAAYLQANSIVEIKTTTMHQPESHEDLHAYVIDTRLVKLLESKFDFRGKYKAFIRKTEEGRLYRHRSDAQIAASKNRRARKDLKRTQLNPNLA